MRRRRDTPDPGMLAADKQLSELERLLLEVGRRAEELLRQEGTGGCLRN